MKALIQHNFTSGMGDFLNCIYEYYITCEKLRRLGYNEFELKLYIKPNCYLNDDSFFDFFDINFFKTIFDKVEIVQNPITNKHFNNLNYIITVGTNEPGRHLWDLFLEERTGGYGINCFTTYSYQKPQTEYLNFFNENLIKEYKNLRSKNNLYDYASIYYRTHDLEDNTSTYSSFDEEFKRIIENNNSVYVSSNSFAFKEYIRKFGKNIITYDIPKEKEIGNHFGHNHELDDSLDILHTRTKYVLFEMFSLADSKEVNFFTLWTRPSNFLLLSKVKNTNIKTFSL